MKVSSKSIIMLIVALVCIGLVITNQDSNGQDANASQVSLDSPGVSSMQQLFKQHQATYESRQQALANLDDATLRELLSHEVRNAYNTPFSSPDLLFYYTK